MTLEDVSSSLMAYPNFSHLMVIYITESQILEIQKSQHFTQRLRKRILRYLPEKYHNLINSNLNTIANIDLPKKMSVAIKIATLDEKYSTNDGSNGDEVWAVVRNNVISTILLSRSNQTRDKNKFRTDRMFHDIEKFFEFVANIQKIY